MCTCDNRGNIAPARHGGSVSAEHGLGFMKAKYIYHSRSRETVLWMKKLKQLFDPNVSPPTDHCSQSLLLFFSHVVLVIELSLFQGILNPYKTLTPN